MKNNQQALPAKHIPQRTCVICRKTSAKREFVRLVRLSGGEVIIDTTGKKAGRGAYLCPGRECWENAFKGGRLEHALRAGITPENRAELIGYAKNLAADESEL